MPASELTLETNSREADKIYLADYQQLSGRTDRLIAWIMGIQWAGAIIASLLIGGAEGDIASGYPHLPAALLLGGLFTLYPIYLVIVMPGRRTTRHLIAGCQMLMSGLLIHISGGRIETHFHIFGSLALLSLYLDWQILVTATVATFIDHAVMGILMPSCLFGASTVNPWRIVEHVLWVLVFDVVLIIACVQSQRRLRVVAKREADQTYQAYHDALTGLGNRLLLEKHLEDFAQHNTSYLFMTLDLDRFKEVNDTLGHNVGDEVLSIASKRMLEEIRKTDHLFRMGGDEFALIVSDCSEIELAEQIAGRVIAALNCPIQSGAQSVHIGVSIGICPNLAASVPSEDVRHNADLALYKVKNTGRNRFQVFDGTLSAETTHNMSLEHRLRSAVLAEALHLHYQPIVNIQGILLGFEALLRWEDAVHGNVSPMEFIPVAERCGLIVPLGAWVLRKACAQAADWQRAGNRAVKMSVNVSAIQLIHEGFVSTVLSALKESGLPATMLDLELTESTLIQNHSETLEALQLLRKFGVWLSIDDFGTGYSSLSYLRDLPVHTLKIDRAFIRDIVVSAEARLLIEGMISMAHTLKLRVVAEGVETKEQLAVLMSVGCDEIQGFHVSGAVSSDEAKRFMGPPDSGQRKELRRAEVHEIPLKMAVRK